MEKKYVLNCKYYILVYLFNNIVNKVALSIALV